MNTTRSQLLHWVTIAALLVAVVGNFSPTAYGLDPENPYAGVVVDNYNGSQSGGGNAVGGFRTALIRLPASWDDPNYTGYFRLSELAFRFGWVSMEWEMENKELSFRLEYFPTLEAVSTGEGRLLGEWKEETWKIFTFGATSRMNLRFPETEVVKLDPLGVLQLSLVNGGEFGFTLISAHENTPVRPEEPPDAYSVYGEIKPGPNRWRVTLWGIPEQEPLPKVPAITRFEVSSSLVTVEFTPLTQDEFGTHSWVLQRSTAVGGNWETVNTVGSHEETPDKGMAFYRLIKYEKKGK